MNAQQLAVIVVAGTLGLLVLLLLVYGRPRRSRVEPLPQNFSRGDQDSVLEGKRLKSIQVWGLASAIFMTGFLALYFVYEPFREARYAVKFLDRSIERGHTEFVERAGCANCHGPDGSGGFATTDPSWPAPPLTNVFYRYSRDEVSRIVEAGRPGTPMPAWARAFGGPLNEQQVEDVVNYVESIQVPEEEKWELDADITEGVEVYERKCAVCHGPDAGGRAMGQPLPTFYAPDLRTEFYRLGLQVKRVEVQQQIKEETGSTPQLGSADVTRRVEAMSAAEIMEAGEEASRNTIVRGRPNTPMPAWLNRIRPEQIDAVVAYLRSIQQAPDGVQ